MKITIPEFCMVVLVGATSAGKSTFAARHFKPSEIVSSDACREVVSDDENDQNATDDAFELVHYIAAKRLQRRKLVVIDATNVRAQDRAHLVQLARKYHAEPVAIVLDPGVDVCTARHDARADRDFALSIVRDQVRALAKNMDRIAQEGFRHTHHIRTEADITAATVLRERLKSDLRAERGPFDIIGDVHGCCDELVALLAALGYTVAFDGTGERRTVTTTAPEGRRVVFVGDLVDRGPNAPDVLRIVMAMMAANQALCVPGNHDIKLLRWLNGRNVRLTHGLEKTAEQLDRQPDSFRIIIRDFLESLVSHVWLEDGKLAVAHAGIREAMLGRSSGAVREFCLYGETSGETDEFGLPIRYNWAAEYSGDTQIIYGHTPVPDAEWLNNTLCIDTGCCFGGKLTALRWPEAEIVSEKAHAVHAEPMRPFGHPPARAVDDQETADARDVAASTDDMLDLEAVTGKRVITTAVGPTVTIQAANAGVALEVMTRFAVAPNWLVYVPATVSPPPLPDDMADAPFAGLEHPRFAFDAYRKLGIARVSMQEMVSGLRAVIVVCENSEAAAQTFGARSGATGAIYSRHGVPIFGRDRETESHLQTVRHALSEADFWQRHKTNWAVFDAVINRNVASSGGGAHTTSADVRAVARQTLDATAKILVQANDRGLDIAALRQRLAERTERLARHQAHLTETSDDGAASDAAPRLTVLQICATDAHLALAEPFDWHANALRDFAKPNTATALRRAEGLSVDLSDAAAIRAACDWWDRLSSRGVPGVLVKPAETIVRSDKGLVQPAFKCRSAETLRRVYGPDYDAPDTIKQLTKRSLALKRALALREFALGHEALRRFIAGEPLGRVHECVFAALAFEAEPIDPRL